MGKAIENRSVATEDSPATLRARVRELLDREWERELSGSRRGNGESGSGGGLESHGSGPPLGRRYVGGSFFGRIRRAADRGFLQDIATRDRGKALGFADLVGRFPPALP